MPRPKKTKIRLDVDSMSGLMQEIYNDCLNVQRKAQTDIVERKTQLKEKRTEKKTENQSRRGTYYKKERRQMQFTRTIKLPADANEEGIVATLNKGVLALTIPKTKTKSKPSKRIEIAHK